MKIKINILIVFLLLVLDQWTKYLVSTNIQVGDKVVIIKDFFALYHVKNDGAAFSMLSGRLFFFYIITIVAIGIVFYFYKNAKTQLSTIATSVLLAGILGNFIDRILFQQVTDFLSFQFKSYYFAIFNFADTYITIAVILFIIDYLVEERNMHNGKNKS